ncbi:MAG: helix-turn-helix domain-containing protein [Syntrophobacter sp.]
MTIVDDSINWLRAMLVYGWQKCGGSSLYSFGGGMDVLARKAFSLKEAAEVIGCHKETLRRAIKKGELKAAKVGSDYRMSRSDLAAYWEAKGGGELFEKAVGEKREKLVLDPDLAEKLRESFKKYRETKRSASDGDGTILNFLLTAAKEYAKKKD